MTVTSNARRDKGRKPVIRVKTNNSNGRRHPHVLRDLDKCTHEWNRECASRRCCTVRDL